MPFVSARNHRAATAAAAGLLLLAVAMHQHAAVAAPAAAVPCTTSSEATRAGTWPPTSLPGRRAGSSRSETHSVSRTRRQTSVAEVAGAAEFESCELGSPIRTYAAGLSRVGLDGEGARYFLSADPAKCKGGLKLRVDVRAAGWEGRAAAAAPAPSASSGAQGGVAPLVRRALCLVSVGCFLFLGA